MNGQFDPRELERQRLMAQYGGQVPPVGMQGSAPAAPMPQIGQQSPLAMQRMNQAGGVGQQFSPVMQPTPQSSVNAMFAPQPGAMQQQIGGMTQGNIVKPPAPEQTDVVAAEMSKMRDEPQNKAGGTDWKGMAKDLAKGLKASGFGSGESLMNQEIKNIGLLQEASAPAPTVGAATTAGQPQGMSAAMQAITGGIGTQPTMIDMLKRMRR